LGFDPVLLPLAASGRSDAASGRAGAASGGGASGPHALTLQQSSLKSLFTVVKHAAGSHARNKAAMQPRQAIQQHVGGPMLPLLAAAQAVNPAAPTPPAAPLHAAAAACSWEDGGSVVMAQDAGARDCSNWAASGRLQGPQCEAGLVMAAPAPAESAGLGFSLAGAEDSMDAGYASDDSNCCPSVGMGAPVPKRMRAAADAAAADWPTASKEVYGAVSAGTVVAWPVSGRAKQRWHGSTASAKLTGGTSCLTAALRAQAAPSSILLAPSESAGGSGDAEDEGCNDEAETRGPMLTPAPAVRCLLNMHSSIQTAVAVAPAPPLAPSTRLRPASAGGPSAASGGPSRVTRAAASSGGGSTFLSHRWALPQAQGAASAPGRQNPSGRRSSGACFRPPSAVRSTAAAPLASVLLSRAGSASQQVSSSAAGDDDCSDDALSCMRRADEAPATTPAQQQVAPTAIATGRAGPPELQATVEPESHSAQPPPLVLDDPLEGVPWSGPPEERPEYYQSRYEQLLYGLDYVPPPPRGAHEDEE
jgi:hypothetical protein